MASMERRCRAAGETRAVAAGVVLEGRWRGGRRSAVGVDSTRQGPRIRRPGGQTREGAGEQSEACRRQTQAR